MCWHQNRKVKRQTFQMICFLTCLWSIESEAVSTWYSKFDYSSIVDANPASCEPVAVFHLFTFISFFYVQNRNYIHLILSFSFPMGILFWPMDLIHHSPNGKSIEFIFLSFFLIILFQPIIFYASCVGNPLGMEPNSSFESLKSYYI